MFKEIDAMAGDYTYISASKLSLALSYQINKAAKDGMRKVSPVYEMCEGNITGTGVRHHSYGDEDIACIFDTEKMARGSAALFVAINDSTPKYNTKSKFLSLPLSFKMALDTVRKNAKSLRAHDTLIKEFNLQEVFGKIDEDGSGLTPYFISDGAGIIMPFNIADTFNNNEDITNNRIDRAFNIHYEDHRNKYDHDCYNFFVQGLVNWFVRHAGNIRKQCKADDDSNLVLNIPITSTVTCISLWDLIVCDAAKDVAIERQYALEPVLKYEFMNGYPYSGTMELGETQFGSLSNIGFTDTAEPITARPIPLPVAARILMPEVFSPKSVENFDESVLYGGNYSASQVIMPWYFNQSQFVPTAGSNGHIWSLKPGDNSYMTFFDSRGGVTFNNMDRLMALDPELLKLYMDRMITIPAPYKQLDKVGYTTKVYKYSNSDDGIPVVNYYAWYKDSIAQDKQKKLDQLLQIHDVLSTPRELGLSFIAPAGVVTPAFDGNSSNYRDLTSAYLRYSGPSFRVKYWHVANVVSDTIFEDHILTGQGVNFSAKYDVIEATPNRGDDAIGMYIYANKSNAGNVYSTVNIVPFKKVTGDASYSYDTGTYNDGETTDSGGKSLFLNSLVKYLYARIQILPFVINPFDACVYLYSGTPAYTVINRNDDFDFLHLYNICGFRAGEYSGVQFDRNRARINLGLGYVSDPYIERRL